MKYDVFTALIELGKFYREFERNLGKLTLEKLLDSFGELLLFNHILLLFQMNKVYSKEILKDNFIKTGDITKDVVKEILDNVFSRERFEEFLKKTPMSEYFRKHILIYPSNMPKFDVGLSIDFKELKETIGKENDKIMLKLYLENFFGESDLANLFYWKKKLVEILETFEKFYNSMLDKEKLLKYYGKRLEGLLTSVVKKYYNYFKAQILANAILDGKINKVLFSKGDVSFLNNLMWSLSHGVSFSHKLSLTILFEDNNLSDEEIKSLINAVKRPYVLVAIIDLHFPNKYSKELDNIPDGLDRLDLDELIDYITSKEYDSPSPMVPTDVKISYELMKNILYIFKETLIEYLGNALRTKYMFIDKVNLERKVRRILNSVYKTLEEIPKPKKEDAVETLKFLLGMVYRKRIFFFENFLLALFSKYLHVTYRKKSESYVDVDGIITII